MGSAVIGGTAGYTWPTMVLAKAEPEYNDIKGAQ